MNIESDRDWNIKFRTSNVYTTLFILKKYNLTPEDKEYIKKISK